MKCPICGFTMRRHPTPFRSHMRTHIRNGEISEQDELRIRKKITTTNIKKDGESEKEAIKILTRIGFYEAN